MLCDDHHMILEGIRRLLREVENYNVIAESNQGEQAIEMLSKGIIPDILVLDINMPPGITGYEVARYAFENYPQVSIICFTMCHDEKAVFAMLNYGIKGFVSKTADNHMLVEAISQVYAGKHFFEQSIISNSIFEKRTYCLLKTGIQTLTKRELEVAKLMSGQKTYKEIASVLNISLNTVENIRVRIFSKTESKTRTEVALFMHRVGLL